MSASAAGIAGRPEGAVLQCQLGALCPCASTGPARDSAALVCRTSAPVPLSCSRARLRDEPRRQRRCFAAARAASRRYRLPQRVRFAAAGECRTPDRPEQQPGPAAGRRRHYCRRRRAPRPLACPPPACLPTCCLNVPRLPAALGRPQNDWTYWCGVGVFHSGVEVYGVEYAFGGEARGVAGQLAAGAPLKARFCGQAGWQSQACMPPTESRPCIANCQLARPRHTHSWCLRCQPPLNRRSRCFACSPQLTHRPPSLAEPRTGHEFDAPGVFATNPREAPGTVAWREAIPVGHTDLGQDEVHALVQRMGQQYKGNRCGGAAAGRCCTPLAAAGARQTACCRARRTSPGLAGLPQAPVPRGPASAPNRPTPPPPPSAPPAGTTCCR